jgi:hypothetical protein
MDKANGKTKNRSPSPFSFAKEQGKMKRLLVTDER